MLLMSHLLLASFLATIPNSFAFTAYECGTPMDNITVIDLTSPGPCSDDSSDFTSVSSVFVEVVQTVKEKTLTAHRCHVVKTISSRYCGHESATGVPRYDSWRENVVLSRSECDVAVSSSQFTIAQESFQVKVGTTTSFTKILKGSLNSDHVCTVDTFVDSAGIPRRWQVVIGSYEVTIQKTFVKLDVTTNEIKTSTGISGLFPVGYIQDGIDGTWTWDTSPLKCTDSRSLLYRGPAELARKPSNRAYVGGILTINSTETSQIIGVEILSADRSCDATIFSTSMENVGVIIHPSAQFSHFASEFIPESLSETTRLVSQISYLHISSGMSFNAKIRQIRGTFCDVKREAIQQSLASISGSSNPHALVSRLGKGHRLHKSGSAAYVIRCARVEVTPQSVENCTEEIPVLLNNKTRYVDPISFTLVDMPTKVPCNDITPPRWLIAGRWYCSYPIIRECHQPEQILPSGVEELTEVDVVNGLGKSIYSAEQFRLYAESQSAISVRRAYLADSSANAYQRRGSDGSFGPSGTEHALGWTLNYVAWHMAPLYLILGPTTSIFLLFMLSIAFLQSLITSISRIAARWATKDSISLWLVFSLGYLLLFWIIIPVENAMALGERVAKRAAKTAEEGEKASAPEEVDVEKGAKENLIEGTRGKPPHILFVKPKATPYSSLREML